MLTQTRFHRRGNTESLMNPAKVVVHVKQRKRRHMILDLLRERVCQAREGMLRMTRR
jgi:hypothetical protein